MNENRLILAKRDRDSLDRSIEVGEARRIVQLIETRTKVRLRVIGNCVVANGEQSTDRSREMQLALK
jgi:hypothetical protein